MPVMFNTLLQEAGFHVGDLRLLRHQDNRSAKDRTPYRLWCDKRQQFEFYQATQGVIHESKLRSPFWASFVGTPSDETLFVGIYAIKGHKLLEKDIPKPHINKINKTNSYHLYDLTLEPQLNNLISKLLID